MAIKSISIFWENRAELAGKNTKENVALYKWEDFAADVRLKSVYFMLTINNYKDFFSWNLPYLFLNLIRLKKDKER